jgi:hypothetical protein
MKMFSNTKRKSHIGLNLSKHFQNCIKRGLGFNSSPSLKCLQRCENNIQPLSCSKCLKRYKNIATDDDRISVSIVQLGLLTAVNTNTHVNGRVIS